MATTGAVSPLQPDEFFPWLARVVGQGELSCDAVDHDITGALDFSLVHRQGPITVSVRVDLLTDGLRSLSERSMGVTGGNGTTPEAIEAARRQVASRLVALGRRRAPLPLLERRNREVTEIRWGPNALSYLCPELLQIGVTRCAGALLESSSWDRGVLELLFRGADRSFRLALGHERLRGRFLRRYGPLCLSAVDEPDQPLPEVDRVQRYVGYVLSLSLHERMTLLPEERPEGEPVDPKEPLGDEANPFFHSDYYACGIVISAMFTSPSRVVPVFHGNRECAAFASYLTGMTETAYLHQRGMRPHQEFLRRLRTVDTSELEAIMSGSQEDLTGLLCQALDEADPELLVVMGTCVSNVIGDSLERSIHDAGVRERGVRTISFETTASELDQHHQILWSSLVKMFDRPGDASPEGGVNLLGYGHASDEVLDELTELLASVGVQRRASMIPRFDLAELESFSRAALNLLYPAPLVRQSIATARPHLRAPVEELTPPFGLEGTVRWLDAVMSALDLGSLTDRQRQEVLEPWRERWRALVSASDGLRMALVLSSDHPHGADPGTRVGVPLLEVTAEMGIGLEVFVIPARDGAEGAEGLVELLPARPAPSITVVEDMDELQRAVARSGCQLFYTEVSGDRRATSLGAVPVSHQDFEMGLTGAYRTLARLQRAARTPFYRRYGRYLPCPAWSAS